MLRVSSVVTEWQRVVDDVAYPHVYLCESPDATLAATCDWIVANRDELNTCSDAVGTLLLRGFPVLTGHDFDAIVCAFDYPPFTYEASLSNAVRRNITPRVFTANEAPSSFNIMMHHEMAQTPIYPSKLFFYCETAPASGGATPLGRSDELFRELADRLPEFARDCETKGLKYSHVMPGEDDPSSGMGRSWMSTFNSETRADAEVRMRQLGYTWQWLEHGGCLATTPVLQAVRVLDDGRKTFFNQLIAFSALADKIHEFAPLRYGDDSAFDLANLRAVAAIADEQAVDLAWQAGDVALVDNYLAMHGRRPFSGTRRVLASLVAA